MNFLDEASCDRCLHRLVQMSDAGKLPGIKSIGQSYIQGFAQLLERTGQSITIYLELFHIPLLEFMGERCYHLTINPDKNRERRGMAKCPKALNPVVPGMFFYFFFTTNSSRRLGVRIGSPGIWHTSPCWHQDELKRNRSSSFLSTKHLH